MNTILQRAAVFAKYKYYMTRENFEQTVKIPEFRVDIRKRHVLNTWVGVATIQACSMFAYVVRISQNLFRYVPVNDYLIFL
jgi:hypothetical protein